MSEAAPDATPTEILVKQKDKPDYICNKICYLLQKKAYVRLSGLEGAIVVAVDAATLLQETRAVSVVSIETSFPEVSYPPHIFSPRTVYKCTNSDSESSHWNFETPIKN